MNLTSTEMAVLISGLCERAEWLTKMRNASPAGPLHDHYAACVRETHDLRDKITGGTLTLTTFAESV